jgi:hypothetical protein
MMMASDILLIINSSSAQMQERPIYIQRAALWNLEASTPVDSGSKSSSRKTERCLIKLL